MDFPSFEVFLETLTEERMVEIMGDYRDVDIVQIDNPLDPKNVSVFLTRFMEKAVSHSVVLNLRVLQAYHEWLSQQLDHQ